MSTDFDKFAILDSFLDEVASYLPEIETHLDRLQQQPGDAVALEEAFRRAHTIGGSAAMMDFPGMSQVAKGMEETLAEALDGGHPLGAPSVALLRRSATRLTRLLDAARSGGNSDALVAEDDADRNAWRGGAVPSAGGESARAPLVGGGQMSGAHTLGGAGLPGQAGPNLPDWLAAFGDSGPATGAPNNDDFTGAATGPVSVPPFARSGFEGPPTIPATHVGPPASGAAGPRPGDPPFDEMLQAFRAGGPSSGPNGSMPDLTNHPTAPVPATWAANGALLEAPFSGLGAARSTVGETAPRLDTPGDSGPFGLPAAPQPDFEQAARPLTMVSPAWEEVQVTETAVERQVGALREIVRTLREAAQAMEDERTELRTFLDGSKDALDRLEDWAGQAMGLDLRQSPEHVRRYLPLSVIWVTTTRLKKLVTLLNNTGRQVTAQQEDITEALTELHGAIEHASRLFSSVAAIAGAANSTDGGFQATVAQVTRLSFAPRAAAPAPQSTPPALSDPEDLPTAEVAAVELPPGARAELERGVREQLRRELEDEVRGEVAAQVRREESDRLRQELEIQVRRQMLAEITPGLGSAMVVPAIGGARAPMVPPIVSASARAPRPVQVTDQSPEALDVFREEADEHLQHIAMGIRQLEANPGDGTALQSIRRATHTLKGAAGMMGFGSIQQLAHDSEDLLDRLVDGVLTLTPEVQGLLLETSEALERLLSSHAGSADEQERLVNGLQQRYDNFMGRMSTSPTRAAHSSVAEAPALAAEEPEPSAEADLSVRLRLSKLDELINVFGDILQNRSVLDERVSRLGRMVSDTSAVSQRLREVGEQLEIQFEAAQLATGDPGHVSTSARAGGERPALGGIQDSSGMARARSNGGAQNGTGNGNGNGNGNGFGPTHLSDFDALELDRYTEFHRLSRGLGESVADMATLSAEMESIVREVETIFARETRLSSAFQDRLMKARLVPLQSLVPRLYRAVRATALKQGKEVEFFVEGGDTEVDRTVFEEVAGPLLHIVRNAVAHGIERPEARERAGKPRVGHVYLSAAEEGNQVVISVREDGAGVDPDRVRRTAVQRGLIDGGANVTHEQALDLIFQPGFSTADKIDEESGRGVGLDVVRDAATRMRGTVEVESQVGQGTMFTLRIPVSLQITRAVLAKVGTHLFAIPMGVVEQIGRLDYYERVPGDGPPAVEVLGNVYPLAHLATYLNTTPGPVDERSPVLLFSSGRQRMALILDGIPGRQEVVVKNLGPHLKDIRGVTGATVLGDGRVVLILSLPELLTAPPRAGARVPVIPLPTGAKPRMPASQSTGVTGPIMDPETVARINTGTLNPANLPRQTSGPAVRIPTSGPLPSVATRPPEFVVSRAEPATSVPPPSAPRNSGPQPVVPSQPVRADVTRLPTGAPTPRSGYVLVVDDSPSVRRVVSNMLKANGWEVQGARDGLEALDVIGKQTPAAVLLDIEMPRMDGYELMATLRSQSQYTTLPLIVLTSRAASKHHQRAIQLGANAYVVKPYEDVELLRQLDELIAAQAR